MSAVETSLGLRLRNPPGAPVELLAMVEVAAAMAGQQEHRVSLAAEAEEEARVPTLARQLETVTTAAT